MKIEGLSQEVKDKVKQLLDTAPADQKADAIMQSIEIIEEAAHIPSCRDVNKIKQENYWAYEGTRDDLIAQGYSPCGHCNP